jgi:methyl-accepting chemotaxis protein
MSTSHHPAPDRTYREFLASRWPSRTRLLALYAFPASFAFWLLDWAFTRSLPEPPGLVATAQVRLPWTLLPVLGFALHRLAPRSRILPIVVITGSVLWTWGNAWAWFRLGLGGSVVQALGLVLCFLCAAAFLPLTRLGRAGVFALFGAGAVALDLASPQARPVAARLWTDGVIFLVVLALGVIFEEFAAAQRRSFLLRRELERSLATLESSRAQVSATASGVASSAEQLEGSAAELASRAAATGDEGAQMTEASQRLAAGARALQDRSRQHAATAESARQRAAAVRGVLDALEAGVAEVERAVKGSEQSFAQLRDRAEDVGGFVESAQDVAAQTHMLALNAGLQAAGAGEHGRAFAVIAAEIRRLSLDSSAGAAEMARLVADIRARMDALLEAMARVRSRSAQLAEGFHEARATLEAIDGTVQALGDAMQANAMDADRQAEASLRVSASIERMAELLRAQALVTADVAGTSTSLAGHAAGLRRLLTGSAGAPAPAASPRRASR